MTAAPEGVERREKREERRGKREERRGKREEGGMTEAPEGVDAGEGLALA